MLFDPDNQDWDQASLDIGESVCDIFVPYTETEEAIRHLPAELLGSQRRMSDFDSDPDPDPDSDGRVVAVALHHTYIMG